MRILTINKFPQYQFKLVDDYIIVNCSPNSNIAKILPSLLFAFDGKSVYKIHIKSFLVKLESIKKALNLDELELDEFLNGTKKEKLEEHQELNGKISKLKATLFPYQKDCINYGTHYKYSIMGCAVGLGKTLISLGITANCRKTIAIVPASLKDNYKREVEKFTDKTAFVIKKWQDCEKIKDESIIIVNYEIIDKCLSIFKGCDAIVCDEVQKVTNPMAKTSKALYNILLEFKPTYFVGLSGTVTNGKTGQFFQLLRMCSLNKEDCGVKIHDDKRYNIHFRFQQFFSHERSNGFGSQFYGIKNYPELKKLLQKKYISQTVEENLPQLPNIIRQFKDVNVKFDSEQEKQLIDFFNKNDEKDSKKKSELVEIKRIHAESKAESTAKFILELLEEEDKIICFSDHRKPVETIKNILESEGIKVSVINGDVKIEDRQKLVNEFQEGDTQVFLATIPTANAGFTLTSSNIVIMNDCSWNPAHIIQCEARSRRIGQKSTVRAFFMVNGKIDKIIVRTLLQKLKTMNVVNTDGKTTEYEINE